ncbi:lipopolysaccharide biosynthesis protein [uncultured Tateyamaria sp.]|uniref:lipopolysaccharide biosynthesis protein n=1 Tax=uncultured Tateyamaria sp. TaxID=455651 RepID=UPI0026357D1E|nr:lipopolysaccharide biosynthesis protein [uncultured Tateyamaria sp.]
MLKGSAFVMALKIVGEGLGLIMIIIVTNLYSVSDAGMLLTLQNNLLLFGTIGALGLGTCFHRFVPKYFADKQMPHVRGLQRWVFGLAAVGLSVIALGHTAILLLSNQTPGITPLLALLASLAVVAWGITSLSRQFMRAMGLTFWAEFSYQVIRPLGGIVLLLIGAIWGGTTAIIILALLLPLLAGCVHDAWRSGRLIQGHRGAADYTLRPDWTASAKSYAIFILSRVILQRLDLFVVTIMLGLEAAAVYGLTTRLASLAILAVDPITAVFLPRASLHHAQGETEKMQHDIIQSVLWVSSTALIVAVIFLTSAPLWIGLFGEVAVGSQSLPLLFLFLAGYFAMANGAIASSTLLMTGNERIVGRLNSFLTLIVYPPLLFVGIWLFGLFGAAIATVLIRSLIAGCSVYLTKRKTGIWALPIPTLTNLTIAFGPILIWIKRRF